MTSENPINAFFLLLVRTAGKEDSFNSMGIKLTVLEANKRTQSEGNVSTTVHVCERVRKLGELKDDYVRGFKPAWEEWQHQ